MSFSPDGLLIASGSSDKSVMIWDVTSGAIVYGPFMGHSGYVNSIDFSPDGTSVVSGSQDGMIRIWNVTAENTTSRLYKEQMKDSNTDKSASSSDVADSSNWVLDEDGWIRGDYNELLLWVPPALSVTLWCPQNTALFGGTFQTRLDFSNCGHGERWQECFKFPHTTQL